MTLLPHYVRGARSGYRLGNGTLEDGITHVLSDPFNRYHMGVTAENLATEFEVTREVQDEFALRSQERAATAIQEGRFRDEIVPVEVQNGREKLLFEQDEHPRQTSSEALAKLGPVFKEGGSVTAGNASGINDGAAAVVLMSASKAESLKMKPVLRLVAKAEAGVRPEIMGSGPIPAVLKAVEKAGLQLDDIDVVELNEAFGSVAAACSITLGLDPAKVNPNGGAIALGHPVGASGAILLVKMMYELQRKQARYGLVSLCIGGGQGIASIFERVD
jgi:acetyl-CoA C-acetyltransferase